MLVNDDLLKEILELTAKKALSVSIKLGCTQLPDYKGYREITLITQSITGRYQSPEDYAYSVRLTTGGGYPKYRQSSYEEIHSLLNDIYKEEQAAGANYMYFTWENGNAQKRYYFSMIQDALKAYVAERGAEATYKNYLKVTFKSNADKNYTLLYSAKQGYDNLYILNTSDCTLFRGHGYPKDNFSASKLDLSYSKYNQQDTQAILETLDIEEIQLDFGELSQVIEIYTANKDALDKARGIIFDLDEEPEVVVDAPGFPEGTLSESQFCYYAELQRDIDAGLYDRTLPTHGDRFKSCILDFSHEAHTYLRYALKNLGLWATSLCDYHKELPEVLALYSEISIKGFYRDILPKFRKIIYDNLTEFLYPTPSKEDDEEEEDEFFFLYGKAEEESYVELVERNEIYHPEEINTF